MEIPYIPVDDLRFAEWDDPILCRPTELVTEEAMMSTEFRLLMLGMRRIVADHWHPTRSGDFRTLVGLAAPQVGVGVSAIVFDPRTTDKGKERYITAPESALRSLVNVEYEELGKQEWGVESCCSMPPDLRIWGLRPRRGIIKHAVELVFPEEKPDYRLYDVVYREIVDELVEDWPAAVVSHEHDHLLGYRGPDRAHKLGEGRILRVRPRHEAKWRELAQSGASFGSWPYEIHYYQWLIDTGRDPSAFLPERLDARWLSRFLRFRR